MSKFDAIVGYESIKAELMQLADMMRNPSPYVKLGASMPRGLLIHGRPGLGKSLMAQAFIAESGRASFILRRSKPDGDFINEIKAVFEKAEEAAPSIIFLDDMDHFAVNEDSQEELTTVQTCIDETFGKNVFVIATANNLWEMPDSLIRAGRFDRKIEVRTPNAEDSFQIIRHYMNSKAFIAGTDLDNIAKALCGKTCAEIETLLNEAAVCAGFQRKAQVEISHVISALLRSEFGTPESDDERSIAERRHAAYHEAGHALVSEVLDPGQLGFLYLSPEGYKVYGYTKRCRRWNNVADEVTMRMAGLAAMEIQFGQSDKGAGGDIEQAMQTLGMDVCDNGSRGLNLVSVFERHETSLELISRQEVATHGAMEQYLCRARSIISSRKPLLDALAEALLERGVLLNSEIATITDAYVA